VEFEERFPKTPELYRFFIGDVRDRDRLLRAMQGCMRVYHAAAMKHVDACEYNPQEAVKTNIAGVQNIIDCATAAGVEAVVSMSTDKAASPCNLMGTTKLVAERLVTQANAYGRGCRFMSVRFGNVLGSRGSVLPLWRRQMRESGEITITDPEATRFVMSIDMAVNFCLDAMSNGIGGEVFVSEMPVVRLAELAGAVIADFERKHDVKNTVKRKITGLRPGESRHEIILSQEEAERTRCLGDKYVLLPNIMFTHLDHKAAWGKFPLGKDELCSCDREICSAHKLLSRWELF